jgi:hypothetical protein
MILTDAAICFALFKLRKVNLPHIPPNLTSFFLPLLSSSSDDYAMLVNSTNFIHILTTLTCLDLPYWCISDHFLSSIAAMESSLPLTRLGLGGCTGYTYSGILTFLSKCLSIQHLDLQSADVLTNHLVVELSSFLPRLVSINLSCCRMLTDSAFLELIRNYTSLINQHVLGRNTTLPILSCRILMLFTLNSSLSVLLTIIP